MVRDLKQRMYPFMLMVLNDDIPLSAVYLSLRARPEAAKGLIRVGCRKQEKVDEYNMELLKETVKLKLQVKQLQSKLDVLENKNKRLIDILPDSSMMSNKILCKRIEL